MNKVTRHLLASVTAKATSGRLKLSEAAKEYAKLVVNEAVKKHGGDKRNAANALDISLSSVYRKTVKRTVAKKKRTR